MTTTPYLSTADHLDYIIDLHHSLPVHQNHKNLQYYLTECSNIICVTLGTFSIAITVEFKVYKAISDSQENCKIMYCIWLTFILNTLICIIKLFICENINKSVKFVAKNSLLYNILF